jgi:hypothetical protein
VHLPKHSNSNKTYPVRMSYISTHFCNKSILPKFRHTISDKGNLIFYLFITPKLRKLLFPTMKEGKIYERGSKIKMCSFISLFYIFPFFFCFFLNNSGTCILYTASVYLFPVHFILDDINNTGKSKNFGLPGYGLHVYI